MNMKIEIKKEDLTDAGQKIGNSAENFGESCPEWRMVCG